MQSSSHKYWYWISIIWPLRRTETLMITIFPLYIYDSSLSYDFLKVIVLWLPYLMSSASWWKSVPRSTRSLIWVVKCNDLNFQTMIKVLSLINSIRVQEKIINKSKIYIYIYIYWKTDHHQNARIATWKIPLLFFVFFGNFLLLYIFKR
jgi:hypothetical protein